MRITYPRAGNLSAWGVLNPLELLAGLGHVPPAVEVPIRVAARRPAGLSDAPCTCKLCPPADARPRMSARECTPANARDSPAQEISVDWWCTMTRRASPEVAGAHTLDSSDAPPSQRTR